MNRTWPQILTEVDAAGCRAVLAIEAAPELLQGLFGAAASPAIVDVVHLPNQQATAEWLGYSVTASQPFERTLAASVTAFFRAKQLVHELGMPVGMSACAHTAGEVDSPDGTAVLLATQSSTATRLYRWRNVAATADFATCRDVLLEFLKLALLEACGESTGANTASFGQIEVESFIEQPSAPLLELWNGTLPCLWLFPDDRWSTDLEEPPGVVLSGSFNPLHAGHVELLRVAEERVGGPACFEMPVHNADKPPLDYLTIARRRRQFAGERLLLTRAPTFAEKALLLPGCTFVVGVDTAVRILDVRFYGNDVDRMQRALKAIRSAGCRFLVAGRRLDDRYQKLAEVALPSGFEQMFVALPEDEFRCDLSSTALRRVSDEEL